MKCYSCRKYDTCPLGWKCSADMYGCSAYEVKQTNEEWLKSCTTEQLAWMISLFVGNAIAKHDCGNDEDIKPIKWVEWLKQPHAKE